MVKLYGTKHDDDDVYDFSDSVEFLQYEFPALKITKIGGFNTFGMSGMYGEYDFYLEFRNGKAELVVGVLGKGHQIPSKMFTAATVCDFKGGTPDSETLESIFIQLMDEIIATTSINSQV